MTRSPQRHPQDERGNDLYETPNVAVEALMRVERLPQTIWEPAAGRGAIVRVLRDAGHTIIASDLVDYGFPLDFVGDFLLQTEMPPGTELILTNSAFSIINKFVTHALDLCPRVIVLARLPFLHSTRRTQILEHRGLARVHIFRNRLPMMHRDGWAGPNVQARAYAHRGSWICCRCRRRRPGGRSRATTAPRRCGAARPCARARRCSAFASRRAAPTAPHP